MLREGSLNQDSEDRSRLLGQRCAAFLPTFADTPQMGAASEHHIRPAEIDHLRKAQAGLNRNQQESVVPATRPQLWIGAANRASISGLVKNPTSFFS